MKLPPLQPMKVMFGGVSHNLDAEGCPEAGGEVWWPRGQRMVRFLIREMCRTKRVLLLSFGTRREVCALSRLPKLPRHQVPLRVRNGDGKTAFSDE